MNFRRTTPLVTILPFLAMFVAAAALTGCERQAGSTNETGTEEPQKPATPTQPTE